MGACCGTQKEVNVNFQGKRARLREFSDLRGAKRQILKNFPELANQEFEVSVGGKKLSTSEELRRIYHRRNKLNIDILVEDPLTARSQSKVLGEEYLCVVGNQTQSSGTTGMFISKDCIITSRQAVPVHQSQGYFAMVFDSNERLKVSENCLELGPELGDLVIWQVETPKDFKVPKLCLEAPTSEGNCFVVYYNSSSKITHKDVRTSGVYNGNFRVFDLEGSDWKGGIMINNEGLIQGFLVSEKYGMASAVSSEKLIEELKELVGSSEIASEVLKAHGIPYDMPLVIEEEINPTAQKNKYEAFEEDLEEEIEIQLDPRKHLVEEFESEDSMSIIINDVQPDHHRFDDVSQKLYEKSVVNFEEIGFYFNTYSSDFVSYHPDDYSVSKLKFEKLSKNYSACSSQWGVIVVDGKSSWIIDSDGPKELPDTKSSHVKACMVVSHNTAFVISGKNNTEVEGLNLRTLEWFSHSELTKSRVYASAVHYQNKLYLLGGKTSHISRSVWEYSDEWKKLGFKLSASIYKLGVIALDQSMVVFGGYTAPKIPNKKIWEISFEGEEVNEQQCPIQGSFWGLGYGRCKQDFIQFTRSGKILTYKSSMHKALYTAIGNNTDCESEG